MFILEMNHEWDYEPLQSFSMAVSEDIEALKALAVEDNDQLSSDSVWRISQSGTTFIEIDDESSYTITAIKLV